MSHNKLLSFLKTLLDPKRFTKIVLVAALALYFSFGSYRLAQFVTADEHYWVYERIPQYWKALSDGKLKKTLINDKPGITLAYVAGAGLFFEKHPELYINKPEKHISVYDPAVTERLNLTFRWPVLFFNGLFSLFFFWIIRKLTENDWIALWTSILILLSPVLLGISRIVNPDSVLWVFSAAATFSLFTYLQKEETKYAALASLFLGLSLLSKYSSVFLIPFFFAAILLYCFWRHPEWTRDKLKEKTTKYLTSYLFMLLGVVALFVVMLPAVLVSRAYFEEKTFSSLLVTLKPILLAIFVLGSGLLADARFLHSRILYSMFRKISSAKPFLTLALYSVLSALFIFILFNWLTGQSLINFDRVPFDIRKDSEFSVELTYYQKMILEFYPIVFSVSPLVLLSLLFLWLRSTRKKFADNSWAFLSSFFLIAYYAAVISTGLLATIRYSTVVYPLLFFLAAFGIFEISALLKRYRFANHLITLFLIFFLSLSLWLSKPFYFDYTNALLPEKYLITGSWGEGGYEAAEYLNSLPDAKNRTVWADYNGVCEFFVGRCLETYKPDPDTPKIDYYVLTRRGGIRFVPDHIRWLNPKNVDAAKYYKKDNPVWRLDINGRPGNFIKIFKADDDLRSAIVTDIDHCPSRAPASTEQLDNFINFSQEKKADFIISLGDNASHRLRNCSETADMDARFIADRLRTSGLPAHFVLGDHDIESNVKSYQNWLETSKQKKTFYSFDLKRAHVIVLDTVLGGEPMSPPCEKDAECSAIERKLSDLKQLSFEAYRQKYQEAAASATSEKKLLNEALSEINARRNATRSWGVRDRGIVSEKELTWLESDINSTQNSRVLIFSDHPLFEFASNKKVYNIANGDRVREILAKSGKEVVAISGEAHLWHEEKQGNVQYYIIDEFRKANGSWAYFTWDRQGFRLEKETH